MSSKKPIRVLVVDGSALMRKLLTNMLEAAGDIEVGLLGQIGRQGLGRGGGEGGRGKRHADREQERNRHVA